MLPSVVVEAQMEGLAPLREEEVVVPLVAIVWTRTVSVSSVVVVASCPV